MQGLRPLLLLALVAGSTAAKLSLRSASQASLGVAQLEADAERDEHPMERVIRLVQELAAQSVEEGKQEQKTYDTFVHWCDKTKRQLQKAIDGEKEMIEKTSMKIESKTTEKEQLEKKIKAVEEQIASLEAAAEAAADDRGEHVANYNKTVEDFNVTIVSLGQALVALEDSQTDAEVDAANETQLLMKKTASQLLQLPLVLVGLSAEQEALLVSAAANDTRNTTSASPLDGAPEEEDNYKFKSGGVIDLLKKLKIDFEDQLHAAVMEEAQAAQEYALSKGARDEAIKVANEAKTQKETIKAALESDLASLTNTLQSTQSDLEGDTKSFKDTDATCKLRASEFKERVYTRGREQEACAYAIKILEKAAGVRTAAPSPPSLIQIRSESSHRTKSKVRRLRRVSGHDKKALALQLLRAEASRSSSRELDRLAMEVEAHMAGDGVGKEVDLLLEKQIWKLKNEQLKDDEKRAWCDAEINKTVTSEENKEAEMQELNDTIQSGQGTVSQLKSDTEAATTRMAEIDSEMHEMTLTRQDEKNENELAIEDAQDAQKAISGAIATLEKFYKDAADAAAVLLQRQRGSAPAEVAAAPDTWDQAGYTGTSQDSQSPGDAIITVLEDTAADFAKMEADTKAQEASDADEFKTDMTDAKKEKAQLKAEAEIKAEETNRLLEKIDGWINSMKMTDRAKALLTKYKEDLAVECNRTKYEGRLDARAMELEGLNRSKALLRDAFDTSENVTEAPNGSGTATGLLLHKERPPAAAARSATAPVAASRSFAVQPQIPAATASRPVVVPNVAVPQAKAIASSTPPQQPVAATRPPVVAQPKALPAAVQPPAAAVATAAAAAVMRPPAVQPPATVTAAPVTAVLVAPAQPVAASRPPAVQPPATVTAAPVTAARVTPAQPAASIRPPAVQPPAIVTAAPVRAVGVAPAQPAAATRPPAVQPPAIVTATPVKAVQVAPAQPAAATRQLPPKQPQGRAQQTQAPQQAPPQPAAAQQAAPAVQEAVAAARPPAEPQPKLTVTITDARTAPPARPELPYTAFLAA